MDELENKNEQGLKLPTQSDKYQTLFERTYELNDSMIITRTNCKLCMSPNRAEAEKMWEDIHRKTYSVVHNWLIKMGEEISLNAIKNHLERHYDKQLNQLRLSEYVEKVNTMMEYEYDKKENIRTLIAVAMNTLSEALGLSDLSSKEQISKIKAVNDSIKLVKELTEFQHSLDIQVDTMQVLNEKLRTVFSDSISKAKTDEEKKVILNLIQQLKFNINE